MKVINFELPSTVTAEHIIDKLGEQVSLQLFPKQYQLKTFYDSFDWRLYRHDLICELNRTRQSSTFTLTDRKTGNLAASTILFEVPAFSRQFNPGKVRKTLEPLLEMRALLPISTLECEATQVNVVDAGERVVLRLLIEEFALLKNRLSIFPSKGHEKTAQHIAGWLCKNTAVTPAGKSVLVEALQLQGRHPRDYASKVDVELEPEMSADAAGKLIFSQLLRTIKTNEQGVIGDIDSEFLHDFRVAIRRTRVALGQFKSVLPEQEMSRYQAFFSWLGKLTGDSRDLDVYLLNIDGYKTKLPTDIRQSLVPLNHLLLQKKSHAHQSMVKQLQSNKYISGLTEWQDFLAAGVSADSSASAAALTVKQLADQRIWKTYRQAVKQGEAIDADSPPEALHRLRKTCKKLRYLIEFFQRLYPERPIQKIIQALKRLQDVLGQYQDLSVQQTHLMAFSEEMRTVNTPGKTFVAIGVLIQDMEQRKLKVRDHFGARFQAFSKKSNRAVFEDLFAGV